MTGLTDWQEPLEGAWWELAYVQFHDVFTGSHPTNVLIDVLASLDKVEEIAQTILDRALKQPDALMIPMQGVMAAQVYNSLPWARTDVVSFPLPDDLPGVQRVLLDDQEVAFDIQDGLLRFMATMPAMGSQVFTIEPGAATQAANHPVETCMIENEFILMALEVTQLTGVIK